MNSPNEYWNKLCWQSHTRDHGLSFEILLYVIQSLRKKMATEYQTHLQRLEWLRYGYLFQDNTTLGGGLTVVDNNATLWPILPDKTCRFLARLKFGKISLQIPPS